MKTILSPTTPLYPASPTPIPTGGRTSNLSDARCTEIVFPGKVPGNNGAGGLLRMHWSAKSNLLGTYSWLVRSATKTRHAGPVRLELIRYSIGRLMDYDNLVSTGKFPIDAIVKAGVLPDDNPAIIAERRYTQQRAASAAAQRTVIRITDLPTPAPQL